MTRQTVRAFFLLAALLSTGMLFAERISAQEQTDTPAADSVAQPSAGAVENKPHKDQAAFAAVTDAAGQPATETRAQKQEEAKQRKLRVKKRIPLADKIRKEEFAEYTLGPGDVIEITVRRHTEFSGRFAIGTDRRIQYPFVGDLELAGLTKPQALERVRGVLADYVANPEIYITIVEYNSKQFYIVGMVARPGKYPMRDEHMPVREAVLAAGLPREDVAALRRALIVRPLEDGVVTIRKVNLLALLYHGNTYWNFDLRSGDIVYLPSTALYKVSTVLSQVIAPFYQAAYVTTTAYDMNDRRNDLRQRNADN